MQEMMKVIENICQEKGFEYCPAYDLIFNECVKGRSEEDAKELIEVMLNEYNQ